MICKVLSRLDSGINRAQGNYVRSCIAQATASDSAMTGMGGMKLVKYIPRDTRSNKVVSH
jgi:hypothetical protein